MEQEHPCTPAYGACQAVHINGGLCCPDCTWTWRSAGHMRYMSCPYVLVLHVWIGHCMPLHMSRHISSIPKECILPPKKSPRSRKAIELCPHYHVEAMWCGGTLHLPSDALHMINVSRKSWCLYLELPVAISPSAETDTIHCIVV